MQLNLFDLTCEFIDITEHSLSIRIVLDPTYARSVLAFDYLCTAFVVCTLNVVRTRPYRTLKPPNLSSTASSRLSPLITMREDLHSPTIPLPSLHLWTKLPII